MTDPELERILSLIADRAPSRNDPPPIKPRIKKKSRRSRRGSTRYASTAYAAGEPQRETTTATTAGSPTSGRPRNGDTTGSVEN